MIPSAEAGTQNGKSGGFTRQELAIISASVCILVLLMAVWRKNAMDLPARRICQSNIKQLFMGFNSYAEANGRLPRAARSNVTNSEDWIFWQSDRYLDQSAIAKHMSNFLSVLRCPADTGFGYRQYPYSYSMNVNVEKLPFQDMTNQNQVILLFEESSPNDGTCAVGMPNDTLTHRHVYCSNAGFLDGHVERIAVSTGTSREHSEPDYRIH